MPTSSRPRGLGRVVALSADDQAWSRAARPDVGNLGTSEKGLVLIGRRKGYRPRIAAGAVQQIGCAVRCAAGAADVFEAQGEAYSRQQRLVGKAIIRPEIQK